MLQHPQYDKLEQLRGSIDNPDILPLTYDGYKPQFTRDRALTAFAQLACLRLNVRRAMISLVDSKSQIILTEATRTLSLSRNTIDREDDRVWLGMAIIDREEGMCTHVVNAANNGSLYTATDPDGNIHTGEGVVLTDMANHPDFKNKAFVVNEPCMRFFAGVPIRSKNGHIIGSYGCSHNESRPHLSVAEFQFMQDMAETVMAHLEMIRDRDDRTKGERMVKGLAEFIEGSCALGRASQGSHPVPSIPSVKIGHGENGQISITKTSPTTTALEKQTLNLKALADEDVDDSGPIKLDLTSKISGPKATKRIALPEAANPNCLFYRAADLIRKSTYADGVVFFRASGSSVHTKFPENLSSEETTVDDSTSASDTGLRKITSRGSSHIPRSPKFTTQKQKKINKTNEPRKLTDVLGLSVSENAPGEDKLTQKEFIFSEASMDHYLRKFPHGKFFSFTKNGSGVSSGDDKSGVESGTDPAHNGHKHHDALKVANNSRRQKFIPTELLKILPAVRTLIFLPLWDSAAERWIAGGFIWTSSEDALMSPHNELPYLKAFGNSITSEYARMNALIADRAKSDFISSISHELRSPLHGILGSTEFLNESDISNYQAGLVSSIETCSKTLLETLEHILDYAKINKLYTRDRNTRRLETRSKHNESSIMGPVRDDVDLNQILEEVSESVCAGHAFRETHAAPGHMMEDKPKVYTPCNLRHVSVSLEIVPRLPFLVRTQPGAIRRIVMNLLGNALKYTNDGYIAVNLRAIQSMYDASKTDITLTFKDTGKGMSLEYQRTRLFSPFSQEDPFADGTGLGLSIVRQIVDSLGGHIDIQSKKNHGTTVEVHLSLPNAGELPTDAFSDALSVSAGKRIAVLAPKSGACSNQLDLCFQALIQNSREWYDVEIIPTTIEQLSELKPDAILCPETLGNFEELSCTAGIPIIVACKNQANQVALRKILLDTLPDCAKDHFRIIAQPLGPAKLGQTYKQIFSQDPQAWSQAHKEHHHRNGSTNGISQEQGQHDHFIDIHPPPRATTFDSEATEKPPHAVRGSSDTQLPSTKSKAPPSSVFSPARPIPLRLKSGLSSDHPPRPHHILCVDDNQVNMRLLTMFMRKIGLAHSTAYHGLEALEKYVSCASLVTAPASIQLRRSSISPLPDRTPPSPPKPATNGDSCTPPFTYVLMDISMPIMDGLEATRRIRAYERERGIQKAVIVALTGLASAEAQRDALEAGVDFYLAKPVKFQDLRKLMDV